MLQFDPSTGRLLIAEDGSLLIECCCNNTAPTCNCCCDTTVPPWLQPSLKITIQSIKVSDQSGTDITALSCLIGEWVLPWSDGVDPAWDNGIGGIQIGTCKWNNTFTAGTDTNQAVFSIEATMLEPNYPGASSNASSNPSSCISIKIRVLSCKDCKGDIWLNKPTLLLDVTAVHCDSDYPAGSSNASSNYSNACGCDSGSYENSLMPWKALNTPANDPLNYTGYCWNHPHIADHTSLYDGTLYIENPRWEPTPPPGDPLLSINLVSLLKILGLTKNPDTTKGCTWIVESNAYGFGGAQPNDKLHQVNPVANCQYNINAHAPYINVAGVTSQLGVGYVYTAYTDPIDLDVGCEPGRGISNQLGYVITPSPSFNKYYLVVDALVKINKGDTCEWLPKIHVPAMACPGKYRSKSCQCEPFNVALSGSDSVQVFQQILPSDPISHASEYCDFPAASGSCACYPAYSCCTKFQVGGIPASVKALDDAPIGARIDILFELDGYKMSVVYEKKAPSGTPGSDPYWVLGDSWKSWRNSLTTHIACPLYEGFNINICVGSPTYLSCAEAKNKITDYFKILPSTVDQYTLHPLGIKVVNTSGDNRWVITMEAPIKQSTDADPCCTNALAKYYGVPENQVLCEKCYEYPSACAKNICNCVTTGGNSINNCTILSKNAANNLISIPGAGPSHFPSNPYPFDFCREYASYVETTIYATVYGKGNCALPVGTYPNASIPSSLEDYVAYVRTTTLTGTFPAVTATSYAKTFKRLNTNNGNGTTTVSCITCENTQTSDLDFTVVYSDTGSCTDGSGSWIGTARRLDTFPVSAFVEFLPEVNTWHSRSTGLKYPVGSGTFEFTSVYRPCDTPFIESEVFEVLADPTSIPPTKEIRRYDKIEFTKKPNIAYPSYLDLNKGDWTLDLSSPYTVVCSSGKTLGDQNCFNTYKLSVTAYYMGIPTTANKIFFSYSNPSSYSYLNYPGYIYIAGSDGNIYCYPSIFSFYTYPSKFYSSGSTLDPSWIYSGSQLLTYLRTSIINQTSFVPPSGLCDKDSFSFTFIGVKLCDATDSSGHAVTPPDYTVGTPAAVMNLQAWGCVKTAGGCSTNYSPNSSSNGHPYYFNDGDTVQVSVPEYAMLLDNQIHPMIGIEGLEHFSNSDNIGLSGLENFA